MKSKNIAHEMRGVRKYGQKDKRFQVLLLYLTKEEGDDGA